MKQKILIISSAFALAIMVSATEKPGNQHWGQSQAVAHQTGDDVTPISEQTEIFEITRLSVEAAVTRFLETITWAPARKGGEAEETAQTISEHETERKWAQL